MSRRALGQSGVCALLLAALCAGQAAERAGKPDLDVAQIIDRYVTARGGLAAWNRVQTMAWAGHLETANATAAGTPFVMEFRRPDLTRFELTIQGQKTVRTYDGLHGWRVRQTSGKGPEVIDFSSEELDFAREAFGMDGPLMHYRDHGVVVALEGVETIDDRQAYHLKLTLPSGAARHSWIDTQSFLELRSGRDYIDAVGRPGKVLVNYRHYMPFEGIQIPLESETGAGPGRVPDRMVIEKVAINPPLDALLFARPLFSKRRGELTIGNDPGAGHSRPSR